MVRALLPLLLLLLLLLLLALLLVVVLVVVLIWPSQCPYLGRSSSWFVVVPVVPEQEPEPARSRVALALQGAQRKSRGSQRPKIAP